MKTMSRKKLKKQLRSACAAFNNYSDPKKKKYILKRVLFLQKELEQSDWRFKSPELSVHREVGEHLMSS